MEGRGGTEGRRTYLYTGEWHRTRCWFKTRSRLYFHKRPTAISPFGFPLLLLLFSCSRFQICVICDYLFFDSPMPSSESYNASSRRLL